MNKLKYVFAGMLFVLSGCQYNDYYYDETVLEDNDLTANETNQVEIMPVSEENRKDQTATVESQATDKDTLEVMHPDEPLEKLAYDSAYDRFLNNVVIKARSENYVTYEYKDVRVDELAPLASKYCEEHGNRTAVLRSVILYKNYARRATFDCLRLQ